MDKISDSSISGEECENPMSIIEIFLEVANDFNCTSVMSVTT